MTLVDYKIKANEILRERKIECSHIEYKASECQFDKILKTICAYGNNYFKNDYSLIFIGVEEENNGTIKATPILPIKGIEEGHLENAKNTLKSLKPYIYPNVDYEVLTNEFDSKMYLLIVVKKQSGGPFQVTEKALHDKNINLKPGRYIRIDGETRIARVNEEYDLLRKFADYHFSSDFSSNGTLDDLDYDYMREYVSLTSSRNISDDLSKLEIAKMLKLFGNNEEPIDIVKNFALLMFSKKPDTHIPYSSIEIITDTFGTAKRMEAKEFSGPIWKQYYSALKYIDDNFIRTITLREDTIVENKKISNFPFKAVEELLANAIVHKNYESGKNIQVYVTNSEINIINYNNPLPPLTIEDLNNRSRFDERDTVNPEIRDMFKDLRIIESYGTGIGEAKRACEENGSEKLYYKVFASGVDITSVVIPCSNQYSDFINGKEKRNDNELNNNNTNNKLNVIKKIIKASNYSVSTKNNLDKILIVCVESVFGPKDIIVLLKCSNNTATGYISKFLDLNVIEPVTGLGKSRYRFSER